ncbi:hypothetical protein N7931_10035 [Catenovulum sp. 2E275]|uniref:hypothetical protein n=1 Tax=Catenovulum sp. 2E275 TaxID=2980497 RepID=UPI0021D02430|nr:hypothetical protein [Catenovulum sp. 2E275]MCU4675974.1 hypothetical protein [Catenovulum sp. 2E275]
MDYKNLASHAKPVKSHAPVTWFLVLSAPIFIAVLLVLFVPNLNITQQILVILCGLVILLGAQLYKAYKEYKEYIQARS